MVDGTGLGPNGMKMTLERFKQIVEAYGAAADRWPADERDAAVAFAAQNPAAAAVLEQERLLDAALGSVGDIMPSAQLSEAILSDAAEVLGPVAGPEPSSDKQTGWLDGVRGLLGDIDKMDWSLKGLVQPGAVLACAALAGLVTGAYLPGGGVSETLYTLEDEDILNVAFGQTDYDLESWTLNGGEQ